MMANRERCSRRGGNGDGARNEPTSDPAACHAIRLGKAEEVFQSTAITIVLIAQEVVKARKTLVQ